MVTRRPTTATKAIEKLQSDMFAQTLNPTSATERVSLIEDYLGESLSTDGRRSVASTLPDPSSSSRKRVGDLLFLLKEADDLRAQLEEKLKDCRGTIGNWARYAPDLAKRFGVRDATILPSIRLIDPALESINQNLCSRLASIDKILRRYRWVPAVRFGVVRLERATTWRSTMDWENRTVSALLDLVADGRIHRLRTCQNPECGKWFFASKNSHDAHKHCSDKCRDQHNSDSDEFRRKRAKYMRERYRPLQKRRAKRAKQDATKVRRENYMGYRAD